VRSAVARAVLFAIAWWAFAGGGLLFGLATVVLATAASLALLPPSGRRVRPGGIARFAWFFARESLVGGIDVALRAFSRRPGERTRDAYMTHVTRLAPGVERSFLVGTVGLLPGTVAVDVDEARIRIHVLDRDLAQPERIEALDRRIAAITRPSEAFE
jgi:multicomponent Na+:H+ antiporter subunit E